MAHSALKPMTRLHSGATPIVVLALLLLAALILMSEATQDSARFGELYSLLLLVSAAGLIALVALISWHLVRLLGQARRNVDGARLTVRMVVMFVVLAVTPMVVVYAFSVRFLNQGIDSWFDVRVENALEDALELSRASLSGRMREYTRQAQQIAADLSIVPDELIPVSLEDPRAESGASELTLLNDKAHIIASSSADTASLLPQRIDESVLLRLRQASSYVELESIQNRGLHVRVVVPVVDTEPGSQRRRLLQVLFPIDERVGRLADNVRAAFGKYKELTYLREPLKFSFLLTLSLVLLGSLGTAIWAAFYSVGRLVSPLRELAEGTRAVSLGDYSTVLRRESTDELGFLVTLFNDMTRKIARARDTAHESQRTVEEQKAYLQAVLTHMSSGVLTLDHDLNLVTYNQTAERILGLPENKNLARPLTDLNREFPNLAPLAEALEKNIRTQEDWREEISLSDDNTYQVLMCRGTRLGSNGEATAGHVIVFDDITALIQAQRNAAWGEVARRLAHEIKNPLTPIQLSAERLRHKYLRTLSAEDGETLDRLTRTIVAQVESMKGMVNAFSDYARGPAAQLRPTDLNQLVRDVIDLYGGEHGSARVVTNLADGVPAIDADPHRLRQVLHNLVKNALEASTGAAQPQVEAITRMIDNESGRYVSLEITDNGKGFPEDIKNRVFEPYVSTKTTGSGLGLAIVKKIVEEHSGTVRIKNSQNGGARVVIRLPVGGVAR